MLFYIPVGSNQMSRAVFLKSKIWLSLVNRLADRSTVHTMSTDSPARFEPTARPRTFSSMTWRRLEIIAPDTLGSLIFGPAPTAALTAVATFLDTMARRLRSAILARVSASCADLHLSGYSHRICPCPCRISVLSAEANLRRAFGGLGYSRIRMIVNDPTRRECVSSGYFFLSFLIEAMLLSKSL